MPAKRKLILPQIEAGQIWHVSDSAIHITSLGKTLVHFKRAEPGRQRAAPIQILGHPAMLKYLSENGAVLAK